MAQKKSKQKDLLKDFDLIAATAHELKSPLVLINGLSDMLSAGQLGKLDKTQRRHIRNINNASNRLIGLVESMLTINRTQHQQLKIKKEPVLLTNILNQIITELESRLDQKQQSVVISSMHRAPTILADRGLLYQVFYNLLDNSIKYSPPNTNILISMRVEADFLRVRIKDEGLGISHKEVKNIFNRFSRYKKPIQSQASSSGLGLFIVKNLVELLGGKITVKTVKKGACFYVKLPLIEQLNLFDSRND